MDKAYLPTVTYTNVIYRNCRNGLEDRVYKDTELEELMQTCFNRYNRALAYTMEYFNLAEKDNN